MPSTQETRTPRPTPGEATDERIKAEGIHYTPRALAQFVAREALLALQPLPKTPTLNVLDPACGDGSLLAELSELADPKVALRLTGLDTDSSAVAEAARMFGDKGTHTFATQDFLASIVEEHSRAGRLGYEPMLHGMFDLVIANPPYVRTQVLGAAVAQGLAREFKLTGRVDLYHAFVVAMTDALRAGGVLALLCSNRFLTTKTGLGLRQHLEGNYDLLAVHDLGDTKLFGAAVLPVVVIARKCVANSPIRRMAECVMTSTYSEGGGATGIDDSAERLLHRLTDRSPGPVEGTPFAIRLGTLNYRDPIHPWVLRGSQEMWLDQVEARTHRRVADLFKIRVGIKTTADSVFIQEDWTGPEQPENELLLPLLTHHVAARWHARPTTRRVLYPYDLSSGRRQPVDIERYPKAHRYLLAHRERLEGRKYVVEAGRNWWEIWVPQRPAEWALPKIVFPDISEEPRFFLDVSGSVVNGDCYWTPIASESEMRDALLFLAVANSSLGSSYYDAVCANKLYAGRRRFITQYVERFPLPDPTLPESQKILELVRRLAVGTLEATDAVEQELDDLVWRSFGFEQRPW